jgi:hypothetical protein
MSRDYMAVAVVGGLTALLASYLMARRLIAVKYTMADALVIEAIALIGGIGAVQSYTALRWLALWGDLSEPLADVAPATVDVFAVSMGYAALWARRQGKDARDRYADWLALSYSVAAVAANLAVAAIDVSDHGYGTARAAVVLFWHVAPVITFLLGSHWLMRRPATRQVVVETEPVGLPSIEVAVQATVGGTEDRYRGLVAEARSRGEHLSDRAAATELGVSRERIATLRQSMARDVEASVGLAVVEAAE